MKFKNTLPLSSKHDVSFIIGAALKSFAATASPVQSANKTISVSAKIIFFILSSFSFIILMESGLYKSP